MNENYNRIDKFEVRVGMNVDSDVEVVVVGGRLIHAPTRKRIDTAKTITTKYKHDKGKGFPYSLPSVGPGADPGVQAVSPQVTISYQPGVRLPLLSARPAVTFPAAEHHRPLAGRLSLGADVLTPEKIYLSALGVPDRIYS